MYSGMYVRRGCWLSLAVGAVLARAPDLTLAVPTPVLADNWHVLVQVLKPIMCALVCIGACIASIGLY